MQSVICMTILFATAINLSLSAKTETEGLLTFQDNCQEDQNRDVKTNAFINKNVEKNEVPAKTNDNVQNENKPTSDCIKEKTNSNQLLDNQREKVNRATADVSKNNEPSQNETGLPIANQTHIDITDTNKVMIVNESLTYLAEEEQTKNTTEGENTTTNNVTETHLPETTTVPVEQLCSDLWPECTKENLNNATEDVARELTTFSLKLFKTLSPKTTKSNVVLAPISVALSLSQLMLGAGGETKDNILKTLYGDVKQVQCVHDAIQNLTKMDSILTANEVFYNKELTLADAFINQSLKFYGSKGQQLSKDREKSLEIINSWISERTNHLIPELLKELSSDLQLMLINVIYFQGKWISRFDPNLTKKGKFLLSPSKSVPVKMMHSHKYPLQSITDSYLDSQVGRFPLSNNCSLYIFMPSSQAADALNKLENRLTQEIFYLLIKQLQEMTPRGSDVSIPQLKLDSNLRLNEVLRMLGLYDLFEYPNLCMLSNNTELAIGDIYQRAVLEVKEEGVKAAIATSISVARTVTIFNVRKPFLFIMASDISRIPILIGRVKDPSNQMNT